MASKKYTVTVRRKAEKALRKLPKKDLRSVAAAIGGLEAEPRPVGCEQIKGSPLYRIRRGDYRIVYGVEDNPRQVTVFSLGHRKDIYRELGWPKI